MTERRLRDWAMVDGLGEEKIAARVSPCKKEIARALQLEALMVYVAETLSRY